MISARLELAGLRAKASGGIGQWVKGIAETTRSQSGRQAG